MSTAVAEGSKELNPTREDFAALLSETLSKDDAFEGSVVKGTITAIEKDLAVIDVGLKMEGRVPVREFALPGKPAELKVGDTVEVYLERIENALGLFEFLLQLVPCGFAASAIAAQHRFALGVLDPVDIDFDFVANLQLGLLARHGEFAQCNAAFAL